MPECFVGYRIRPCRESITGIGVVWVVESVHGRCGCGAVEMKAAVAWFSDHSDALGFVAAKNDLMDKHSPRDHIGGA
jgi:hypothetical protein